MAFYEAWRVNKTARVWHCGCIGEKGLIQHDTNVTECTPRIPRRPQTLAKQTYVYIHIRPKCEHITKFARSAVSALLCGSVEDSESFQFKNMYIARTCNQKIPIRRRACAVPWTNIIHLCKKNTTARETERESQQRKADCAKTPETVKRRSLLLLLTRDTPNIETIAHDLQPPPHIIQLLTIE